MSKPQTQKRKNLGSFPFATLILTISASLFMLGVFGALVIYSGELASYIKENIELQVYLDKNISNPDKERLIRSLENQPFTSKKDGKPQVILITKEQLATDFIKETGEDFISFLGDNPLPDMISMKIVGSYAENARLSEVKKNLEGLNGVSEVVYQPSLIESINANLTKIGLILVAFVGLLLVVIYLLINNTIKLALFSQRFLIRSMQLVGATSWYIQRPFLWRALTYGLVAGLIASATIFGLIQYAYNYLPELRLLENTEKLLILSGTLIAFGMAVSFFSSLSAVRKYLKMSLDELY